MTLFDADGRIVAEVKSAQVAVGQTRQDGPQAAALVGGTATLYEDGKPAVALKADQVRAYDETQTVTARGNVVARSLTQVGAPAMRADRMTWSPRENKLRGDGNVLITREPDLRIPGRSFVAELTLQRFRIKGNGQPATASFSDKPRKNP